MEKNETDKKRVRRAQIAQTKTDFAIALSQLMAEKPLARISVAAVVARAGYARRTFYRHFATLDDILRERIDELTNELYEELAQPKAASFEIIVQKFFQFWEPHKVFLRQLANNERLFLLEQSWALNLGASQLTTIKVPNADYLQRFALGGMFALLVYWIEQGGHESPQAMAKIATSVREHLR